MATMEELAQTIATAATGKDVREAMAEAVRQFDTVKGAVYQRMKEISDEGDRLDKRIDELSVAITNYEKVTDDRLEKIEKMLYGNDPQSIEHTEPADVLDGVKIVEINK